MATNTHIQELADLLASCFINSIETAETVARAFLQCGRNRNIVAYREMSVQYTAAAVYALAHHLPMRVAADKNRDRKARGGSLRFRSKVGDVAHLAVLLSLPPRQVLSFCFRYPEVQQYLPQLHKDLTGGRTENLDKFFEQLTGIMSHNIQNLGLFSKWSQVRFTFWVSQCSTATFGEVVHMDVFDVDSLQPEEQVKRARYNISLTIEHHHIDGDVNLKVIGERFRVLRGLMGFSQKQLAEQLGITPVACNRMEAGGPVSAGILLTFLLYYSNYFNIDIIFDKRMWELAQYKHEALYKKVHITSVLNRKLKMMKQIVTERLAGLQKEVNLELEEVYKQVNVGMDSAISLTDGD